MDLPQIVSVQPDSAAGRAGLAVGDLVHTINGERPRDVIAYQLLVDGAELSIEYERGGLTRTVELAKAEGEPLGLEVHAAVFDQVRTCDNHCGFCFIYQLPKGMRSSLYLKDDDYRLSFLYGNFTTLTRFTEADLERVITESLSPLYVSIHAVDRARRAELLRNRRGGISLRWLRALLDHQVEVHGQVVVCPGINDGPVLEQTLVGILSDYPELASVAVVPLGISDHSNEPSMRAHTAEEARSVVELVSQWQEIFEHEVGRRLVYAADEYYLLAGVDFPPTDHYGQFEMYEDGIGMARHFEAEFNQAEGTERSAHHRAGGFFASVDGAPALGYRAPRVESPGGCQTEPTQAETASVQPVTLRPSRGSQSSPSPVGVITGTYGARVLEPLLHASGHPDVRAVEVANRFFGGNIGVTGLLVGADIAERLESEPVGDHYLLPDVCLSGGRFLDGLTPADLPRPVEVIPTDGAALRHALTTRENSIP